LRRQARQIVRAGIGSAKGTTRTSGRIAPLVTAISGTSVTPSPCATICISVVRLVAP